MAENYDLVRSIYGSCALSAFWLGIVLNVFLCWLILKKTPAPMQIYNKLLLAPCLMCILIAIYTFLVQPIPANVAWFHLFLLFICCTTVQFGFRYYMMSRDGKIPLKLKYLTGFVIYVLLVAHVALHYWSDYPYDEYTPSMVQLAREVHTEIGISEIRFSSFTWAVCFIKTRRHIVGIYGECGKNNLKSGKSAAKRKVKTKVVEMANARKNDRLREYNAQVTTAFVIQAILPTIEVIELTVQTTLPIFLASERTIHFMVYAAIPLYFIPVLNPLATMLLVKPYQMAVLKMLGLKTLQQKETVTMTQKQLMPANFVQDTLNCRKIPVSPQAVQPMFSIA